MGCVDKFGILGLHLLVYWYQLTPCPGLSLLRFAGWVVALWLFVPVLPLNCSDFFAVAGIELISALLFDFQLGDLCSWVPLFVT
jgi:hypothetical protein